MRVSVLNLGFYGSLVGKSANLTVFSSYRNRLSRKKFAMLLNYTYSVFDLGIGNLNVQKLIVIVSRKRYARG